MIPQPLLDSLVRCANASPDVSSASILDASTVIRQESPSCRTKQFQATFQINFKPFGRARFGAQVCPMVSWTYEEPEDGFTPEEWDELVMEKSLVMHIALVMKIKREAARLKKPGARAGARTRQNIKRYQARRSLRT